MKATFTVLFLVLLAFVGLAFTQPRTEGTLKGRVIDPNKALIIDANVTLSTSTETKVLATDGDGEFHLALAPGIWRVVINSPGFATYERTVTISPQKETTLEVKLDVALVDPHYVTSDGAEAFGTDPGASAGAVVLKKDDLKALPDDPAELQAALQALAGPGAGPDGGEVFIDGFSGGKLPKKETIREVRINQNPFSSEYDRPGFGRIEILTKPGTEDWHGQLAGEFEDDALNSRNPYSTNKPPFQLRNMNGEFSGPLIKNKLSFNTDLEREAIDNNAVVNAIVLDAGLNAVPFSQSFVTPSVSWDFGHRFDWQINKNHTLVARFGRETFRAPNNGFGGFALPSQAAASTSSEYFIRLTETAVISPTIVNETRFQFMKSRDGQTSIDNTPTIQVLDAFTGGGGNQGVSFNNQGRHEFTNITSIVRGNHVIRTGGRVRYQGIDDTSHTGFAGTFTFSSLDQYRNTILNAPGAYPTQFNISGGEPQANVKRWDVGVFFQDDIRLRPEVTMSFGLRYERQTNISSPADIAPRFAIAWAPGAGGKSGSPRFVVRAGFGVFYDRFATNFTLQALRFNGIDQKRFIVTDPAILDPIVFTQAGVSNVPTIQTLSGFALPQTTRVVATGLRTPYTMQAAASIEKQLPLKTTLSVSYINSHTQRMLRSRNVNAPVNGVRPNPAAGNIFQYESTGHLVQNQIVFNFRGQPLEKVSFFGNYSIGFARSDTEGAGTFPANQYDVSGEYGRSSLDVRQRFTAGTSIKAPWGIELSPFVTYRSGTPFNITTGTDVNGDNLFTDRPSFANVGEVGAIASQFGNFDPTPEAGDIIIPRNYGRGPVFFQPNLQILKAFKFGKNAESGSEDDDEDEGKYSLEFSAQIRNFINRTNRGTPVGNLQSTFFGKSVSSAGNSVGNRRVRFELTFSF